MSDYRGESISINLVLTLIAVIIAGLLLWSNGKNRERCEKAGGVWLMREYQCVKGLTRINP